MRHFLNPPLPSRIYPLLYQVRLPESTPSFQNIPPFLQLYVMLPQSTPPSKNIPPPLKMRPSQNLPHLFRIYPPFLQLYVMLTQSTPPSQKPPPPHRNATLPESTHPSRIYPLLHHYICDTPIIDPSLP